MHFVVSSDADDLCNVNFDILLMVLGVLPDLLDLDPLLLDQAVRVLEPHEGYNGISLNALDKPSNATSILKKLSGVLQLADWAGRFSSRAAAVSSWRHLCCLD